MNSEIEKDLERFIRLDQELRELNVRCAEVRSRRQKYQAKLLRKSDDDLNQVGMNRIVTSQYQPLTHNFLRSCLSAYFKKDEHAANCISFILNQRAKSKRERVDMIKK